MGYAVGASGTILKTTNGGGLHVEETGSKAPELLICPNPSADFITIESPVPLAHGIISIVNFRGQEYITCPVTNPKTHLDISNLSPGVYFVRLTGDKTVQVGKFVKE